MKNFYVTFGQKYRHEPHPQGGHPDGWARIEAESFVQANEVAHRIFGPQFAFVYGEEDFDRSYYPKGELPI